MYLSREEERILDGEKGWAYQVAMRILVKLGDLFGADRLIPIESAHISGVSYKTIGDASIDFLEALGKSGVKVMVKSTANPAGIDYSHPEEMIGVAEVKEKQNRIIEIYRSIGIAMILGDMALVASGNSMMGQFRNPYPYIAVAVGGGALVITQFAFWRARAMVVVPTINSFIILTNLTADKTKKNTQTNFLHYNTMKRSSTISTNTNPGIHTTKSSSISSSTSKYSIIFYSSSC